MTGGGGTTGGGAMTGPGATTDRHATRVARWYEALDARHLERLTVAEVRRGLQALSAIYVERRGRHLASGEALAGAGKRAAFALFYGTLHFMLMRAIVRATGAASPAPRVILDLGCGTGVAGAAWALETDGASHLAGVDRSGWAIEEARFNWHALGLHGTAARGDVARAVLPGRGGAILAAFLANELSPEARAGLRDRLLAAAHRGAAVLVVEPVARRALAWWDDWAAAFAAAGGRADTWRFPADLPERIRLLDRAAHLDHRELTGRSLFIAGH
jgi:hypothetical protein